MGKQGVPVLQRGSPRLGEPRPLCVGYLHPAREPPLASPSQGLGEARRVGYPIFNDAGMCLYNHRTGLQKQLWGWCSRGGSKGSSPASQCPQ
eukprot:1153735-Pelagomonas_calceolata.AAC.2